MGKESKRTEGKLVVMLSDNATPYIEFINPEGEGEFLCHLSAEIIQSHNSLNNAKFMVKAWNNHDGLVEALREVYSRLDYEINSSFGLSQQSLINIMRNIEKALKEV